MMLYKPWTQLQAMLNAQNIAEGEPSQPRQKLTCVHLADYFLSQPIFVLYTGSSWFQIKLNYTIYIAPQSCFWKYK